MFARPMLLVVAVSALVAIASQLEVVGSATFFVLAIALTVLGAMLLTASRSSHGKGWHRILEGRPLLLTVLATIAVLIGGVAEIVPSVLSGTAQAPSGRAQTPYTALELEGRDIYLREGCYTCHSQMIRPLVSEAIRYGEPSTMEESQYDHPFQWGSKRTGPDLARVGSKLPMPLWHYQHMIDPRSTSPGSNMPPYGFLADADIAREKTEHKLRAMKRIGVPYTDEQIASAAADQAVQAAAIAEQLHAAGETSARAESELIALIAYLQRLGAPPQAPQTPAPIAHVEGE